MAIGRARLSRGPIPRGRRRGGPLWRTRGRSYARSVLLLVLLVPPPARVRPAERRQHRRARHGRIHGVPAAGHVLVRPGHAQQPVVPGRDRPRRRRAALRAPDHPAATGSHPIAGLDGEGQEDRRRLDQRALGREGAGQQRGAAALATARAARDQHGEPRRRAIVQPGRAPRGEFEGEAALRGRRRGLRRDRLPRGTPGRRAEHHRGRGVGRHGGVHGHP
ncbi:hypothetical protein VTK73DRAFT_7383 [Phialemonium thermophilum]|uniref:Uncharacterized protein n=1 Tax=Phialemonium thermophilum TaxID=223376 RepID=A0ABR3WF54_9PEZI